MLDLRLVIATAPDSVRIDKHARSRVVCEKPSESSAALVDEDNISLGERGGLGSRYSRDIQRRRLACFTYWDGVAAIAATPSHFQKHK
jgi:hypothetical protein